MDETCSLGASNNGFPAPGAAAPGPDGTAFVVAVGAVGV